MGGSNSSSANKEDKTISSKQRDISKQIDNENDDLFTQEISYLDTTNNAEKELVYFESTDRSRRRDIKYGRNVIKLDVIEAVNLSTSSDGQVTYAHIDGKIVMNPRLSGMPKCCCHFNSDNRSKHCDKKAKCVNCTQEQTKPDVFANEDFQFHPWVTSANLGQEKIIDFMPPDGNFELLRYRITENVHIPFQIAPVIRAISQNRIDILITVKSVFKPSRLAQKIKLQIPIPPNTKNVLLSCLKGRAKRNADNNTITWKIKRMGGMKETQLRAKIELSDDNYSDMAWAELPVLMMNFELPFALSGIKMIKLNVCEPNLKISNGDVIKWVRYMSIAGVYEIKYKTVS